MKNFSKNPFERKQKGAVTTLCVFLAVMLMTAGSFSSCGSKNDEDIDDTITIENLYALPLEEIQEVVQGKWKLQYHVGGFAGGKTTDTNDTYMHISEDRIIIGNKNNGVKTDSPFIWEKWEDFAGFGSVYTLTYNIRDELDPVGKPYADRFLMREIKNGVLAIWDCWYDGYTYYYKK